MLGWEKWNIVENKVTCSDLKLPLSSTNTGDNEKTSNRKQKEKVGKEEEEESQNNKSVGSPEKLRSLSQAVNSQESCAQ